MKNLARESLSSFPLYLPPVIFSPHTDTSSSSPPQTPILTLPPPSLTYLTAGAIPASLVRMSLSPIWSHHHTTIAATHTLSLSLSLCFFLSLSPSLFPSLLPSFSLFCSPPPFFLPSCSFFLLFSYLACFRCAHDPDVLRGLHCGLCGRYLYTTMLIFTPPAPSPT